MMKSLPAGLNHYKSSPDFNETSVPAGLLKQHTTAKGVWGRIRVFEGSLCYRILFPVVEEHILTAENYGVVEPQIPHEVKIIGAVKFCVDFLK